MKTRMGYVSNSSSSSFVVVLRRDGGERTSVTKEQEDMLRGYGFRYVKGLWKTALVHGSELLDSADSFGDNDGIAMYLDVPCNEDEVEEFLFGNCIPFVESDEYGTRIVQYDGIHDYYDTILNEGTRLLMYCFDGNAEQDEFMKSHISKRPFCRTRISDGKDITDESFRQEVDS